MHFDKKTKQEQKLTNIIEHFSKLLTPLYEINFM